MHSPKFKKHKHQTSFMAKDWTFCGQLAHNLSMLKRHLKIPSLYADIKAVMLLMESSSSRTRSTDSDAKCSTKEEKMTLSSFVIGKNLKAAGSVYRYHRTTNALCTCYSEGKWFWIEYVAFFKNHKWYNWLCTSGMLHKENFLFIYVLIL